MSKTVDKILSAIDRALGEQDKVNYAEANRYCWRCMVLKSNPPGSICNMCRDFLMGASDYDPRETEDG